MRKARMTLLAHISDTHILPPGEVFACMAEGMLLGMEGIDDNSFTGTLRADRVDTVTRLARRHQFRLAGYKTKSVLGFNHANSLS